MKPRRPIAPEEDLTWRTSRRSVSARERRNADLFLADLMGHGARPPFEDQGEGAELEVGPSGLEPIFGDPRDESWRVVARPGERVDVEALRGPDGRLRDDTMVLRRVSRGSRRAPASEATDEAFDIVDPWLNDPRPNPRPRPGPGYTPPGVVNPWPDPPLQWNPAYLPSAARSAADYKATLGPIKAASEIEGKDRKGRPRKGTPVGPARLTVEHMMQIYAAAKVAAMLGPKGADGHRPKEAKIAAYVDHINDAFRIMRIDTVEAQALFIAHSVGETGLSKLTEGQINSFEDDPAQVRVDTSLMTDKQDPEGKKGQVLGPRRYSRARHAESGTVDPLRLIPDNGPMDENQFDKTFIGRGAIQVTHVHNYQHVLMVLERRADDLQKEIDANPNAPDAKQKAHDIAKLREVVAAVAADPSQAARPEYTFLFTMGHMHASPMVKVAAVLDKNEDFGGKGRASAGMTGGRTDHRGQFKHDAYVKAYELLAKKAAPLGEAVIAGSPEAGIDPRQGTVLGDEGRFASVVIDDTVEIKATLPGNKTCQLDVYADSVDEHDLMKTTGQLAKLGSQANVRGAVVFRWKVTPLGVPVFRLRLEISAGGKLLEKRLSTVVWLFDWVDFTLADPDYVDPLAREGTPRAEVAVDNVNTPTITVVKQRAAWAEAVGVIEDNGKIVGGVSFKDSGKGRSLFSHLTGKSYNARVGHNQIFYADVKKGSSAFDFYPAVTPRTSKSLLLSSRLRLSIWADPALFQTAIANPRKTKPTDPDWVGSGTFSSAAIDAGGGKTAALDDFTMLNVFSLNPALTPEQQKRTNTRRVAFVGTLDSTFWRQVIKLCHSKNIQVIAGYVDIITTLSQSRLLTWLDSAQLTRKEITDFADEIVQFLTADLAWDGVDFDIEHLPVSGSWSAALRKNIQIFFGYLGGELIARNLLVSIAGTSFTDHTHVQSAWVPATGSGTGLPVTLAHLSPNIIYRPMAYDNAFLGDQLRKFHRQITRFAISPAGDQGAGLHPSGFQLGVKIFKGTNNGPKGTYIGGREALQGYMTGMPLELQTTCRSVLRPHRTGLIMFSWGLQSPGNSPGWDTVVKLDEALNSVEPAPIPDRVDKAALDALSGAARFPHATLGQPLQGAFMQESLDRLKK